MTTTSKQQPWLVRMQYAMRFSAFTLLFAAASLDMFAKNRNMTDWALLGLVTLSYPHIQYIRTRRSANALDAELMHLVVDPYVVGVLIAATGASLWLSLTAILGTLMDNVTNKGWSALLSTSLGFLGGALLWSMVRGFSPAWTTPLPVAIFCFIGMAGYLLVMSNNGYRRNAQLRTARQTLQHRETELVQVNADLRGKLLENLALQKQLTEQTNHDPLTGLYNRRYLDFALTTHMARRNRDGSPLTFVMIDVDHFKDYNDCYGHQTGDDCLQRIALTLRTCVQRASDLVARYGGEEFLIVLPDTGVTDAYRLAGDMCRSIEALNIAHKCSSLGKVTISIGLAVATGNTCAEAAGLLQAADEALYRAKNSGRNRVCGPATALSDTSKQQVSCADQSVASA